MDVVILVVKPSDFLYLAKVKQSCPPPPYSIDYDLLLFSAKIKVKGKTWTIKSIIFHKINTTLQLRFLKDRTIIDKLV